MFGFIEQLGLCVVSLRGRMLAIQCLLCPTRLSVLEMPLSVCLAIRVVQKNPACNLFEYFSVDSWCFTVLEL